MEESTMNNIHAATLRTKGQAAPLHCVAMVTF
jgi:hypothetical protein